MLKKYLPLMFISLFAFALSLQSVSAQTTADSSVERNQVEKIKTYVSKRGTGEKSKVVVKMRDGTKLKGYISQNSEDSFELTNSKTKQTTSVAYRDVAQVKKQGLSTTSKILIGVGIGVGVTAVVLAIALRDLDFGPTFSF